MKRKVIYILIIALILASAVSIVVLIMKNKKNTGTTSKSSSTANTTNETTTTADTEPSVPPTPEKVESGLVFPIADFKNRITKKPFGIYITPKESPVQPERFAGYHTGTDIEYQDVTGDVPVYAVADGIIRYSKTASGYGGALILEATIDGKLHSVLYGHIRPSTLTPVGTKVEKGKQIGLLGTGYSSETDGERRHLHFAVLSNHRIDIKGYVSVKAELSNWIDPVTLYQ